MYQSQNDKERFCRHYTVNREHAFPVILNNYGNHVVFQVSPNFLLFLSYFIKLSWAPIKQSITKLLTRFRRILIIRFSEIRQQIRVIRELLDQTALKTILLKKQINITHAVLEFCTGRFVTSSPWESNLRNNLNKRINLIHPFIQIIPQGVFAVCYKGCVEPIYLKLGP